MKIKFCTNTNNPCTMSYNNLNSKAFISDIKTKKNVVILDVRTAGEALKDKLENAIIIDLLSVNFKNKVKSLDKAKSYYIYCRSGNRSHQACQIMSNMGFPNITNLNGGIFGMNQ